MKRVIVLVSALALLAITPCISAQDPPLVGKSAPVFDLPMLDGGQVHLEDMRGKIVVLHFGTGW